MTQLLNLAALAARIEAALAPSSSLPFRDDEGCPEPPTLYEDRKAIADRYAALKRTDSFTAAEVQAKCEWVERVLGEAFGVAVPSAVPTDPIESERARSAPCQDD